MKKVVIAERIGVLLEKEQSFLDRSSIGVFQAPSNEEALSIHRAEKADLIIADLDDPAMTGEKFCSIVRESAEMRGVSIIIAYFEEKSGGGRLSMCRANAFVALPADIRTLLNKAQKLLNIPKRGAYRAPIGVKMQGKVEETPFLCYSDNISSSGMLFETDKTLEKGDIILCSFFLPDSRHIVTDAEIVRAVRRPVESETNQYGIRFTRIEEKAVSAIEAFIEENSRKK